jgi:prevent-host-death family protein
MRQAQWQLQTAKAQLSELIEAALRGRPQRITRRGKDAVMVLSERAYIALKSSAIKDAPDFTAHLLAMPRHKKTSGSGESASRTKLALRDIDL